MVRNFWMPLCFVVVLNSCGNSGSGENEVKSGDPQPNTSFFQFRGDVKGLDGKLVLSNNGGDGIEIQQNGLTTFPETWTREGKYEIRVMEEPCGQRCVIEKPRGQISTTGLLTLSISCSEKTWEGGLPDSVSESFLNTQAESPSIEMNRYGDILLTWYQSDFYNLQLYKKTYENRQWSAPSSITDHVSFSGSDAFHQSISLNDNNEGSIAWIQNTFTGKRMFVGDYKNSKWSFPQSSLSYFNVSSNLSSNFPPVVKSNNLGEKILLWGQSGGSKIRLYKAEYKNGSWDIPINLVENINPDGTDVSWIDAAMDDFGNKIIVWQQSDGVNEQIFKSEYRNGIWTHPLNLSDNISPNGSDAHEPHVAMNNSGEAYIVWFQYDNTSTSRYQIYVSSFQNGGWTHPANLANNISPNGKHSKFPKVVMNDSGKVVISSIYRVDDSASIYQVVVQEKVQSGWSNPMSLSATAALNNPSRPSIGIDLQGNVLVAWAHQGTGNVYKSEYRNGDWLLADLFNPINFNSGVYDSPQVTVNNCRSAIAWQQKNEAGVGQIYLNHYY